MVVDRQLRQCPVIVAPISGGANDCTWTGVSDTSVDLDTVNFPLRPDKRREELTWVAVPGKI